MRMPSRLESSLMSEMPSMRLSSTISPMRLIISLLFTMYGTSVTTMQSRPRSSSSISVRARTTTLPRPVVYASMMPWRPWMMPPVGKSGPLMCSMRPSTVMSGLSMYAQMASQHSERLCGAMLVAIPTAMPADPLRSRRGALVGSTVGSGMVSSKLSWKSTVFLSRSARTSSVIFSSLASV